MHYGQVSGISGHADVDGRQAAVDLDAVSAVLEPVLGQRFIQRGIAGGTRQAQQEKQSEKKTGYKCGQWMRENSLHGLSASYNRCTQSWRAEYVRETVCLLPESFKRRK